eukprot:CAMPEP_0197657644 /NCGR_PEP_ID=MMETSP1338-20131121/44756_1 /TAXON_ID=43686 ORGANISM="Pelagodinium beii, Strain RCC1491" /NCGR_SAMPLE_ID=MMETSP1338 /ASSEMBLY_ACC=CAM_ASM_000754 /LENGTH=52 /DNA_ID=CAMNT_0043234061 /DNA_START=498 /DNA_END=656 /DNA_ORIENTATION=-
MKVDLFFVGENSLILMIHAILPILRMLADLLSAKLLELEAAALRAVAYVIVC